MKPVVVRGAGDLATGTIIALSRAGWPVIALECATPSAIRREAAFCEAVYKGEKTVEGVLCRRAATAEEAMRMADAGNPVILVDESASSLRDLAPDILVDAILAKRNCGTRRDMAPLTIALGPGFTAGEDVDFVIETMRGHRLGRIISSGTAIPNTGIPGIIAGYGAERVIHAPGGGIFTASHKIGDIVKKGEPLGLIETADGESLPVPASLAGVLRGLLPDGFRVYEGLKMADIDPRISERENCLTVSDKARCIAGSVLLLAAAFEHGCIEQVRREADETDRH